jgi:hypothetical protein
MKLPQLERCIVPEAKITRYLLDLNSPKGQAKAAFFLAFGFTIEVWQGLAQALIHHAQSHEVSKLVQTDYGVHYVIEGILLTPDGRNPQIRSVWAILNGDDVPRLVTAYPA